MNVVERILALLGQAELSEAEQTELTELYGQLSDEDCAALESGLMDLFDSVRDGAESITPEVLGQLERIADTTDGVRALAGERITQAEAAAAEAAAEEAQRQERLAALDGRMRVGDAVASEDDPDEPDDEPEDVTPPVEAREPEPVAAAAPPATAPRSGIERNRPQRLRIAERPTAQIRSAYGRGELADFRAVDRELARAHRDIDGTNFAGNLRVATFENTMPADRILPEGDVTDVSDRAEEVRSLARERNGAEALTADGGICGPVEFYYGLQTLGQASRPLRGVPTSFQATRGGIKFNAPMTLSDIVTAAHPTSGAAISTITAAEDAAATYNKSFQTVTCASPTEVLVDIFYRQLEFGVLQSRTNPERNAQFTDLSLTAFARYAEQALYTKMLALAHKQHTTQQLGASRDLLNILTRWAINRRAQHRMDPRAQLNVIIPAWVGMGLIPEDQVKALQSYPEQFQVTAEWFEARLRERNIVVDLWYQDDFTTAITEGGFVNSYPSSFHVLGYHPGAFVYVDGGSLDIGVHRDATLINDNKFRVFDEEFWNVGMWGIFADDIAFSLCANGASAGSIEPTCGS